MRLPAATQTSPNVLYQQGATHDRMLYLPSLAGTIIFNFDCRHKLTVYVVSLIRFFVTGSGQVPLMMLISAEKRRLQRRSAQVAHPTTLSRKLGLCTKQSAKISFDLLKLAI